MANKSFNFTDVLTYGWRIMKANIWFFVPLGFIWIIISYIPAVIEMILGHSDISGIAYTMSKILINLTGWLISIILGIGLIKIALAFCDQRKPTIATLFDFTGCFWRYAATMILYGLIILGGFLLFIVPGVIWAVKFNLCLYFVIDKGLGPIQALKASSRTTMGAKWELFGFGILCGLINLLGLMCLIFGIFATYPVVIIAYALVYRQLLAQTPELDEFAISPRTDDVQPNPNWAPPPQNEQA